MLGKIRKTIYSHFILIALSVAFIVAYYHIVVSNAGFGGIIFSLGALVIAVASVPIAFVAWFKDTVKTVFRSFLVILVGGFLLFTIVYVVTGVEPVDLQSLLIFVAPLYISITWILLPLDIGYIVSRFLDIRFKDVVAGWSITLIAWPALYANRYILPKIFLPFLHPPVPWITPMLLIMPWLLGLLIDRLSAQK